MARSVGDLGGFLFSLSKFSLRPMGFQWIPQAGLREPKGPPMGPLGGAIGPQGPSHGSLGVPDGSTRVHVLPGPTLGPHDTPQGGPRGKKLTPYPG